MSHSSRGLTTPLSGECSVRTRHTAAYVWRSTRTPPRGFPPGVSACAARDSQELFNLTLTRLEVLVMEADRQEQLDLACRRTTLAELAWVMPAAGTSSKLVEGLPHVTRMSLALHIAAISPGVMRRLVPLRRTRCLIVPERHQLETGSKRRLELLRLRWRSAACATAAEGASTPLDQLAVLTLTWADSVGAAN